MSLTKGPAGLDGFRAPGPLTDLGPHAERLREVPAQVPQLVAVVQGLLLHRAWAQAYGVSTGPERLRDEGLRGAAAMLDRVLALDPRPLTEARPPADRMIANCRHFAVLLTALLRHQGVPARARCGFAAYFENGRFVDHWVCEYWHEERECWLLADAQLDELQRRATGVAFNPLDVPRDRFFVAGEAWRRCRDGDADPSRFGIAHMWGLWFIGGDLRLDVAALQRIEMLPWDVWGVRLPEEGAAAHEDLVLLDRAAGLSVQPDAQALSELRRLYDDPRLRVPDELLARATREDAAGGVTINPLAEPPE